MGILANTGIEPNDLDMELLKIASSNDAFGIDRNGFMQIIRDNAVTDGEAIEHFLGQSSNGQTMTSEDCRDGLLHALQRRLGATLTAPQNERMFDLIMADVEAEVSMEQWVALCKRAGRIVRLARF